MTGETYWPGLRQRLGEEVHHLVQLLRAIVPVFEIVPRRKSAQDGQAAAKVRPTYDAEVKPLFPGLYVTDMTLPELVDIGRKAVALNGTQVETLRNRYPVDVKSKAIPGERNDRRDRPFERIEVAVL